MARDDDLLDQSAGAITAAIADKTVSALEVTQAAIARIEARDGAINAVVVRDFDRALASAKAADGALARGERKPLLGVPMTVKEAHNVAGLATTWGIADHKGFIAKSDSVGVTRLKDAGAIILGKTNVPVNLSDWQSVNPIYGRTRNPYDLARSPGGSSGGSAAALAARMVPLEFGSDIAGSIRLPASFCGVYGHKPSWALIPQRGHSPPGIENGPEFPLAVIGPMARTAQDLSIALSVLAGPDGFEAVGYRLALPKPRHERLKDFRVLMIDEHPSAPTDAEIRGALDALSRNLAAQGAKVERSSELVPNLAATYETYITLLMTAMAPNLAPPLTAQEYIGKHYEQWGVRQRWAALFNSFDVVIAPVSGALPFPHDDEPDQNKRTVLINGKPAPYFAQSAWPGVATLAHLPATAVPIGQSRAGLPIGAQIIGPYLEDLTTIEFAKLIERAFGGYRPPQGY